ncbi:SGNH/GDSL hydrolase family protein [Aspergillus lucknowensis]|uniref:Lysophospholipase A n=1 Tax=Aspergillus lucknowensis TaxID=176173 RepID=A0ABR4M715_9EURO
MMVGPFVLALAGSIPLIEALPSNALSRHGFDWHSIRHLVAFGDSYTYVQGIHGRTNYSFIGDQFDYAFNARKLLTNKIVQSQTGTSAGGPNWLEYLAGCGVEEGLTSPLSCKKQLWDFAFAGADISAEHLPLHHNYTVSFVNQITQYTTFAHPVLATPNSHGSHAILNPESTLVAIWIGINDINDSAAGNDGYGAAIPSFPAFYNTLMSTLFDSVSTLHELGYRNYLFLNLPPLDRNPANQDELPENRSPNATQVGWFNSALERHASLFRSRHGDGDGDGDDATTVLLFDAHSVLSGVLDSPGAYGIVNTTDFCPGYDQPDIGTNYEAYGCPTALETYFWYNSGHITSRVHEILAKALGAFLGGWKGD